MPGRDPRAHIAVMAAMVLAGCIAEPRGGHTAGGEPDGAPDSSRPTDASSRDDGSRNDAGGEPDSSPDRDSDGFDLGRMDGGNSDMRIADADAATPDLPTAPCGAPVPLVLWNFTDAAAGVAPNAGSGGDYPLDVSGASVTMGRSGRVLAIAGGDTPAGAPHASLLEVDAITVAMWLAPANPTMLVNSGLFTKDASGTTAPGHMRLIIASGEFRLRVQGTGADPSAQLSHPVDPAATWTHVAFTIVEGRTELWVDGQLVDSQAVGWAPTTNPEWVTVGGDGWAASTGTFDPIAPFVGRLDDVAIWGEVLTGPQIAAIASPTCVLGTD